MVVKLQGQRCYVKLRRSQLEKDSTNWGSGSHCVGLSVVCCTQKTLQSLIHPPYYFWGAMLNFRGAPFGLVLLHKTLQCFLSKGEYLWREKAFLILYLLLPKPRIDACARAMQILQNNGAGVSFQMETLTALLFAPSPHPVHAFICWTSLQEKNT